MWLQVDVQMMQLERAAFPCLDCSFSYPLHKSITSPCLFRVSLARAFNFTASLTSRVWSVLFHAIICRQPPDNNDEGDDYSQGGNDEGSYHNGNSAGRYVAPEVIVASAPAAAQSSWASAETLAAVTPGITRDSSLMRKPLSPSSSSPTVARTGSFRDRFLMSVEERRLAAACAAAASTGLQSPSAQRP